MSEDSATQEVQCPRCGTQNPHSVTECLYCGASLSPTAQGQKDGRDPRQKPRLSYYTLWSLICGLMAPFFLIPVVFAIGFGVMALREIRRSEGRLWGAGLAVTGMCLPVAWIAATMIANMIGSS